MEAPWPILDATARIELGIEAGELPASCGTEVDPVLLTLRPGRKAAAVVVGESGDPKFAVHLRLGTADAIGLVPVSEPDRMGAERIDLGHQDFETLAVGADTPEFVAPVVGVERDARTTTVSRKHERTGKSRSAAEVRPRLALEVVELGLQLECATGVTVYPFVLATDAEIVVRPVLLVVVGTALEVDLLDRLSLGKVHRVLVLHPREELVGSERGRRSSIQSQSGRNRNESLLEHDALLGLSPLWPQL